jgi:hypothetical protein
MCHLSRASQLLAEIRISRLNPIKIFDVFNIIYKTDSGIVRNEEKLSI